MAFSINSSPFLGYHSDSPHLSSVLHLPEHLLVSNLNSSDIFNSQVVRFDLREPRAVSLKCRAATEEKFMSGDRMLVFVPPHPLIKHWVSVLRSEQTPCPIFIYVVLGNAMAELGRLLIYEASRDWLTTIAGEIQSPMGTASVELIDPREPIAKGTMWSTLQTFWSKCWRRVTWPFTVSNQFTLLLFLELSDGIVPILRAGLALAEHASSVLPATNTYHLGIGRDEETLQPTVYLNKLPKKFLEGARVFIVDPMLATGGTVVAAVKLIKDRGVVDNKQIKVICAVAAPPALKKLSENLPGLHVYAGILDPAVDDKGFIIPGLGDAGDRSFGT
ncbi:hypothetical protein OROHE_013236 [Orobanche hederae]